MSGMRKDDDMRILISNDDGIFAPGLMALVRAFSAAGHTIYVAAPDSQRSAASHSMTLFHPLTARERAVEGAEKAWAIDGTPVDCVKLAVKVLCPEVEFVISGINHGYNAGSDVLYSGTVGAAMEGALNGRPAIAVSLGHEREDIYDKAAALAVRVFDGLRAHPLPPFSVLNLNYPERDEALGLKATSLRTLRYLDDYEPEIGEDGETRYTLVGGLDKSMADGEDDYTWLKRGYATMTVLTYDLTHDAATKALAGRI